jgi:cell division septation protein DedD
MSTIQFAASDDAAELIRELKGEGFTANLRQVSDDLWELDVDPWDDRVVAMVDVYGGWLPGDTKLPDDD